ncbi:hypothetical protein [Demequina flava]|uniref:hypothetical protein n=1 Tax=Demequina flava TaxID=1095025 RepID=UPI00128D61B2|nr:hypothetical protein [Demequina flava]
MVSLSVKFSASSLMERWDTLAAMLTALSKSKRAATARKRVGKAGQVKFLHLVHGRSGWHAHLHLLYVLDRSVARTEVDELARVEESVWQEIADKHNCKAVPMAQVHRLVERAQDDRERVARYFTKALEEIELGTTVDEEILRCRADHDGSRSGWQLIEDYALREDPSAAKPLQEWLRVMIHTKRQSTHIPRALIEKLRRATDARGNDRCTGEAEGSR